MNFSTTVRNAAEPCACVCVCVCVCVRARVSWLRGIYTYVCVCARARVCLCACVKGAVKTLMLTKGTGISGMTNQSNVTSSGFSTLKLIEGRPNTVSCDSVGGYPPPVLDLFLGTRDVTKYFFARCVRTDSKCWRKTTLRWNKFYIKNKKMWYYLPSYRLTVNVLLSNITFFTIFASFSVLVIALSR